MLVLHSDEMVVGAAAWAAAFPALWHGFVARGFADIPPPAWIGLPLMAFAIVRLVQGFRLGRRRIDLVRRGGLVLADLVERSTRRVSRGPDIEVFVFEVELPAAAPTQGYRAAAPTPTRFRFTLETEEPEGLGDEPKEPVLVHPDHPDQGLALDDRKLGLEITSDVRLRKRRGALWCLCTVAGIVGGVLYALFGGHA